MTSFYFVRHGQTDVNIGKISGTHNRVPLNETGRAQIERTRSVLPELTFSRVVESPYPRVTETANILLEGCHQPRRVIDELAECTWEEWQEMERIAFRLHKTECPSVRSFTSQTEKALNTFLELTPELLVVSHGGVFRALCYHLWVKIDWHIENGELVHFVKDEDSWRVERIFSP